MVIRFTRFLLILGVSFVALHVQSAAPPAEKARGWSGDVEQALARAGTNRGELVNALQTIAASQRRGMAFLVAHMPRRDLQSLKADFLLENVRLAYEARAQAPWGKRIPEEIFLNDVLPYANLDEARHPWRAEMRKLCLPLIKECKTPGEAAQKLNRELFGKLKVRYSTGRKKANQSPRESIEQGLASCSGLSILLSDACRSVAIPARLAGTPLWANKKGNHTWVEVWDGRWHFTGAAEADPQGLDRSWFAGEASKATKDSFEHAIYAASFRRTRVYFPLVWDLARTDVFAENVTDRYTGKAGLTADLLRRVEKEARAYFEAGAAGQKSWKFDEKLEPMLLKDEAAVRAEVWKAYRAASIHQEAKKDFTARQVRFKEHLSPYTVKKVGKKPAGGWPLFIALHGGGGAPKKVNDSQWRIMQTYYRDQPAVSGYLYVALRAPNDTWNGFYTTYVLPLMTNLVRQFLLFGEVNPDKVFLMGYSHGGYGAFYVGPLIPDRFAAVHASAAAPTDGTISPKNLRNTRFTFMIGETDSAYGRVERCQKFSAEVEKLQKDNKNAYPVKMEFMKGFGHGGLPDRDKIKEMAAYRRTAVPRRLTWDLTGDVVKHFFWLSVSKPGPDQGIDASIRDNAVVIRTRNVKEFSLGLDGRLVRFDQPLRVTLNGKSKSIAIRPSLLTLCRSMSERGDPKLACSCRVKITPVTTGK